jgi:o-succinylbenzoate synthase
MRLQGIELRRVEMPLVSPFRVSSGTLWTKSALLLRVVTEDGEGWGECVADEEPLYSYEHLEASLEVLRRFLIPALSRLDELTAADVLPALRRFRGYRMAKAALEMGILDAELRARGIPLAQELGAVHTRVPCGVSVGIMESIDALLETVERYLAEGYVRIKLKIEPGWDVEPVRAVRERYGGDLMLQVDANGAYSLAEADQLMRLDPFELLLLEQPLPEDELLGHAKLARRMSTPICLDESITSAQGARDAISLGACRIINIKAGRVGGYLEARAIHDLCRARNISVWCGGMVETGLGRAANVALAALPGFVLPGDVSGSERFFSADITPPFVLEDGHLKVPTSPGLGVLPSEDRLREVTTWTEWLPLGS